MSRIPLVVAACAAAAVLLVPAASAKPILKGSVGPGFTITLKSATGAKVSKLKPGVYAIQVSDKAAIHDFHLTGPGVNKVITSVGFKGMKTFTVTLKKGKYTYMCDPHSSSMRGSFTVA